MNHTSQQHHASGLTVPLPSSSTSGGGMSTVESTKAMVRKRITTWEYLRRAHEGRVYWFNVRLFFLVRASWFIFGTGWGLMEDTVI